MSEELDAALVDLARAALGEDPEMYWSANETLARRESRRLFIRTSRGEITPDKALLVFTINMRTKLSHSVSVVADRLDRVVLLLSREEQDELGALIEFSEFFLGVSDDSQYSINRDASHYELIELFRACASGQLTPAETQDAVFDNLTAKRDTTFRILQVATRHLVAELVDQEERSVDAQLKPDD